MMNDAQIIEKVRDTLVAAGSTFRDDKKNAYCRAIATESNRSGGGAAAQSAL